MEHEYYDHTRKKIVPNQWSESIQMFKKRLRVYLENQDLLTIKQQEFTQDGRNFVE